MHKVPEDLHFKMLFFFISMRSFLTKLLRFKPFVSWIFFAVVRWRELTWDGKLRDFQL